jgi:hypothetical protein
MKYPITIFLVRHELKPQAEYGTSDKCTYIIFKFSKIDNHILVI